MAKIKAENIVKLNYFTRGKLNKISDVNGVTVGHYTVSDNLSKTGVTVIMPSKKNIFAEKLTAASYVLNGYGKTSGLLQIDELGTLESPIALTNTLNVGIVQDGLIDYMLKRCRDDNIKCSSINTVAGECNDSRLNDISLRKITQGNVAEAIKYACADFKEGSIGAGRGTVCFGFKGGIGSSSRIINVKDKSYTLGVLVQSNYGKMADLCVNGKNIGRCISQKIDEKERKEIGSIMMIVATDAPLSCRQLKRILKRCPNGLARLGSITGNGSGEVVIGFSTSDPILEDDNIPVFDRKILNENYIDLFFRAAGEACEEAVLKSMFLSDSDTCLDGSKIYSLSDFDDMF